MKRFFTLFLVVLVCISLCVNMAFASDVITASVDQNILVYFPWFGGVSGSSANRVTNYATVTTSDVISSNVTLTPISVSGSGLTTNGITVSSGNPFTVSGTATRTETVTFSTGINIVSGHVYYLDTFSDIGLRMGSVGLNTFETNTIFSATGSGAPLGVFQTVSGQSYNSTVSALFVDLTSAFGAGNEPNSVDDVKTLISGILGSYQFFNSPISLNTSTFSLVPAPAANGGSSSHQINDYTWYQYEADISLAGNGILNQGFSHIMYDDTYSYYLGWRTGSSVFGIYYGTSDAINNYPSNDFNFVPYTLGTDVTSYTVNNQFQPEYVGRSVSVFVDPSKVGFSLTTTNGYITLPVNQDSLLRLNNVNLVLGFNDGLTDYILHSDNYFGDSDSTYEGTFTIDRIFRTIDSSYFLFNNQVNLGTYDFNVNVKFPSLDKFNSFSGYWMASFNTSWGEISVRTQIQEVSSNSDTLIKIYKLTFDVPFTGQYTKFNIKYVGDSSAFTTIRVDASVIDPNGYVNGGGPTTINGLSFYLTSMFDKFWGKIRSLFFDNDQTMAESVPPVAGELAEEVSSGAETIHEFETNNFDSIETQQQDIDWDIPDDFGSSGDTGSAIGFVSMLFMGIYQALGVKVQYVIVVPLILGLVLLVLGRGSMALGKLVDSLKR